MEAARSALGELLNGPKDKTKKIALGGFSLQRMPWKTTTELERVRFEAMSLLKLGKGPLFERFGRRLGSEALSLTLVFEKQLLLHVWLEGPCALVDPFVSWGAPQEIGTRTFERSWSDPKGWRATLFRSEPSCSLVFKQAHFR